MPQVILPNVRDAENPELQVQYLYDAYYKIRKELEYLLQNLDSDNVIEAQSVVADWVYAGTVTTDQLIAGEAKIGTALIEDLVVGGNVTMGPDATISWSKVTDKPTIPVLPSYIKSTYIDSTNVISPNITGGILTGGLIRTSLPGYERLELTGNGFIGYNAANKKNGITVETGSYGFSALRFYQNDALVGNVGYDSAGTMSINPGSGVLLRASGSWDFSGATVTGLTVDLSNYATITLAASIAMSVAQAYMDNHVSEYH